MKIRNNRKGFTLVELIVVLVIIAILAAITVPTMSTYIDKANEKKIVTDARSLYLAAQTILTEAYAVAPEDFGNSGVLYSASALKTQEADASLSSFLLGKYNEVRVFDTSENKFFENPTDTTYYNSSYSTYEDEIHDLAQLSVTENEYKAAIQFSVETTEIVSMIFVSDERVAIYNVNSNSWKVSKASTTSITSF